MGVDARDGGEGEERRPCIRRCRGRRVRVAPTACRVPFVGGAAEAACYPPLHAASACYPPLHAASASSTTATSVAAGPLSHRWGEARAAAPDLGGGWEGEERPTVVRRGGGGDYDPPAHRPPRRSSSVEPRGWTMTTARGRPARPRAPAGSRSAETAGKHAPRRPHRRSPAGELARPRAAARNNFLLDLATGERMVVISMGVSQQAVGVASRGEVERRRGGGGRTSVWRWIGLAVGWGRRDGGRDDRGWKETNPECAVYICMRGGFCRQPASGTRTANPHVHAAKPASLKRTMRFCPRCPAAPQARKADIAIECVV
jgi:hypothetical protein